VTCHLDPNADTKKNLLTGFGFNLECYVTYSSAETFAVVFLTFALFTQHHTKTNAVFGSDMIS